MENYMRSLLSGFLTIINGCKDDFKRVSMMKRVHTLAIFVKIW